MKYKIWALVMVFFLVGCLEEVTDDVNDEIQSEINSEIENEIESESEDIDDFNLITKNKVVSRTNEIRQEVFNGSLIVWSDDVAQSAQNYAEVLASSGAFEHDLNNNYGENLYASSRVASYVDAIDVWYSEKPDYTYENNSCASGKVCGHYTQLIWEESQEMGCGISVYKKGTFKGGVVIVCRYNPPGNFIGEKPFN